MVAQSINRLHPAQRAPAVLAVRGKRLIEKRVTLHRQE